MKLNNPDATTFYSAVHFNFFPLLLMNTIINNIINKFNRKLFIAAIIIVVVDYFALQLFQVLSLNNSFSIFKINL